MYRDQTTNHTKIPVQGGPNVCTGPVPSCHGWGGISMILSEFLKNEGTDENLAELILFLSTQASEVRKGFLSTCMNTAACGTKNMFGEDQKPLDKYADDVFVDALSSTRLTVPPSWT